MENNEIMTYEEYDMVDEQIVADDGNGFGTGMAYALGALSAAAVYGLVKAGKWAIGKIKANREKKADEAAPAEESGQANVEAK